eukprot:INCI4856.2.p2 GENE.INCI4856.2~~INCI4856.2.p2  ORF type:complete len:361 (+),score=86.90 INCI4856.2:557-1639(+)
MSFGSMKWDFTAKSKQQLPLPQKQQQRAGANLFSTPSSANNAKRENAEAGRQERTSNTFFSSGKQQPGRNPNSGGQHKRHFQKQGGRQFSPRKASSQALAQLAQPNANVPAPSARPKKPSFSLNFNATPQKRPAGHNAASSGQFSASSTSEQRNVPRRHSHRAIEAQMSQHAPDEREQEQGDTQEDDVDGEDDRSDAQEKEDSLDFQARSSANTASEREDEEDPENELEAASVDGCVENVCCIAFFRRPSKHASCKARANIHRDQERAHRQPPVRGYENLASALPRAVQEDGGLEEIATKAEDLQSGLDHIQNSDSSAGALEELLSDYDNHIKVSCVVAVAVSIVLASERKLIPKVELIE